MRASGQSILSLGMALIIAVMILLGFLSVEVNRFMLAREQTQAAADAAALAGAATLASSNNLDPATAQGDAAATALNTFQQNYVLGQSLGSTILGNGNGLSNFITVEFLNPNDGDAVVSSGDPNGKIVQVTTNIAYQPLFGALGLNSIPIVTNSHGGVPALDLVLCFDVSGSIDDQTPVTFVRRRWLTNKIVYDIVSTSAGSPAGSTAQGTIFNIIGPPATGTRVGGSYPENLDLANNGVSYPLVFSETQGASGNAIGLRGTTNAGSPPGNCPPGTAGIGNSHTFTDLVVNLDGNTRFQGFSSNGYDFPDIATLVEAARGNLENNTVYVNSKANTSLPNTVPKAGYQAEYFALAMNQAHPLIDAQQAAANFYTIMNTNTNAHFGLVAFADNAGTSAGYTQSMPNVDTYYTNAGTGNFPCPQIILDPTTGNTNYSNVLNALPGTRATSGTNIGDAVNQAVNQLRSHSRSGSKKAIVLFTDGEPTSGGPLSSDPFTNARLSAVAAKNAGIPIYTIGLAQVPAIIPDETAILNDTNSSQSSGGMAAIAGNGGKFFLVTNTNNLNLTFENIARQLVQLVQ